MKKINQIKRVLLLFISVSSVFCLQVAYSFTNSTHRVHFEKILTDPIIVHQFDELKDAVERAEIYQQKGRPFFSDTDIKNFNAITDKLLKSLKIHEHLIPINYKAHSYVGKYQSNSCYQYYNSFAKDSIGKTCSEFPKGFSNCNECDQYVTAVRAIHKNNILHSHWWKKEAITSLVKVVKLKNGDEAYVGFELSPRK